MIVTGTSGTVSDALEHYKSGRLQAAPEAPGAHATGMPGAGMGRGMGMGLGAPVAPTPPVPPLPAQTIDEEIQVLESQIKDIKAKLEELNK